MEKIEGVEAPPGFWKRHSDKVGAGGALLAGLCCLGFPAALAALSAVGLGFLINDVILLPALVVFVGVTIHGLWRGRQRHHNRLPLRLGLVGAGALLVSMWFSSLLAGTSLVVLVAATVLNGWSARCRDCAPKS